MLLLFTKMLLLFEQMWMKNKRLFQIYMHGRRDITETNLKPAVLEGETGPRPQGSLHRNHPTLFKLLCYRLFSL